MEPIETPTLPSLAEPLTSEVRELGDDALIDLCEQVKRQLPATETLRI